MRVIHTFIARLWRRIPSRIRPYVVTEPLRLLLPKAQDNMPESGPMYIVGVFFAPTGLGQGARLFFQEKKRQGFEVYAVDVTHLLCSSPPSGLHEDALLPHTVLAEHSGPGTVVVHLNPPAFMLAVWKIRKLLPGKRIIAYWAWELEDIPHSWTRCLDYLDEAFAPSVYTAASIRKHTSKPVHVHPHAALPVVRCVRHVEHPFTVLSCFDIASNFNRKNPLAVVAAFGDSPEARLVLKVNSMERYPKGREQLLQAADAANIHFCLGCLSERGMAELYAAADVYLSLHRSEGFGLTIQEAMLHGLPVIATGWSGNMDFMQGERCYAVPYSLVPVQDPQGSYAVPGTVWAEPDIEVAAKLLWHVRKMSRRDVSV